MLVADIGVRGVWQYQSVVLFDICVVDTDALSYLSWSPTVVLASAEAEKKRKYCAASSDCCATFTPLCFLVDGLVMRPIDFCEIWHVFYLLIGIIVLVRSLASCVLVIGLDN